jgi:hypothetical protein
MSNAMTAKQSPARELPPKTLRSADAGAESLETNWEGFRFVLHYVNEHDMLGSFAEAEPFETERVAEDWIAAQNAEHAAGRQAWRVTSPKLVEIREEY